MCNPASFLITKKAVLWSKQTDSHTALREEHGIAEETDSTGRLVKAVAVEITPPNNDFNAPLKDWAFRVDQDILPEWWDAKDGEKRARKTLADWVAERVVLRGQKREVKEGLIYAADGSEVVARGSSKVEAWDSSNVVAWDSSNVVAWDSSKVEARDSSKVVAWDSSKVEAWDSSNVVARDSSKVEAWDSSNVVARGSSKVEARDSSKVEAWDSSNVVARGSSKVEARDNCTVNIYRAINPDIIKSANAVLIDRSQSPPKVYVGIQNPSKRKSKATT